MSGTLGTLSNTKQNRVLSNRYREPKVNALLYGHHRNQAIEAGKRRIYRAYAMIVIKQTRKLRMKIGKIKFNAQLIQVC